MQIKRKYVQRGIFYIHSMFEAFVGVRKVYLYFEGQDILG